MSDQQDRGPDRRSPERKSAAVREAIRDELAGDAPVVKRRDGPVVQLDHVSLAFDVPILEDISLLANQGETLCIVGESGTGKSTILKRIPRLLVPDKGRVLIDGENIAPLSFEEALVVRQKMGMVFQG